MPALGSARDLHAAAAPSPPALRSSRPVRRAGEVRSHMSRGRGRCEMEGKSGGGGRWFSRRLCSRLLGHLRMGEGIRRECWDFGI
ncbi:hypothetical protein GUJ93_ZPchr0009g763 [Zizania palustris]|uniref:Uncharacterized protein n=1 Tax=Zizania palustris TaxID=103762 RepID=A0A8J5S4F1_ZIZPA|nr:hypothetical protein GUJ93_ZPchr0009g763 [Zizania palustris]